jgi:hypothetical protein
MTAKETSHAIIWSLPATLLALSVALAGTAVLAQSLKDYTAQMPHSGSRTPMAVVRVENPQIPITRTA